MAIEARPPGLSISERRISLGGKEVVPVVDAMYEPTTLGYNLIWVRRIIFQNRQSKN
jgi:hypothetical protein